MTIDRVRLDSEALAQERGVAVKGGTEMVNPDDRDTSVLVVEDDPDQAALLASQLRDGGFNVRTVMDGEHALREVRKQRPDVITLDLQMPRKSGLVFYRQLKSDPEYKSLPVVVVSGIVQADRDTENFVHTILEAEHVPAPDAYLEKPVGAGELVNTVRAAAGVRLGTGNRSSARPPVDPADAPRK